MQRHTNIGTKQWLQTGLMMDYLVVVFFLNLFSFFNAKFMEALLYMLTIYCDTEAV